MVLIDPRPYFTRKHWPTLEDLEKLPPSVKTAADALHALIMADWEKRARKGKRAGAIAPERLKSLTPEVIAIGILAKNRDLTIDEIAKMVGRSRGTLYRWPTFMQAYKRLAAQAKQELKDQTPAGLKTQHTFEAWK